MDFMSNLFGSTSTDQQQSNNENINDNIRTQNAERLNEYNLQPNTIFYYIVNYLPGVADYLKSLPQDQFNLIRTNLEQYGTITSLTQFVSFMIRIAAWTSNLSLQQKILFELGNLAAKKISGFSQEWINKEYEIAKKQKPPPQTQFGSRDVRTLARQPPFKTDEGTQRFEGFEQKNHVALIGTTNSGKTSWLITSLLKGQFKDYDMFVFVGAKSAKDDVNNLHKAVAYDLKFNKKKDPQNNFVFFHNEQIGDAIQFCEQQESSKSKLCFFDDLQTGESKMKKLLGSFILKAKHSNCTIITTLHNATDKEYAKQTREACRYFVLFNIEEGQFNFLLNLPINNSLYNKYKFILGGKYQRVLIYDKETQKSYYGTGKNIEFDPLLQNENKKVDIVPAI